MKIIFKRNDRYLNQCTNLDKLGEICNKKPISGYIGFYCTALVCMLVVYYKL